jgi:hypothetical protein
MACGAREALSDRLELGLADVAQRHIQARGHLEIREERISVSSVRSPPQVNIKMLEFSVIFGLRRLAIGTLEMQG